MNDVLGAVGIVHVENGSLRKYVGPALARRMFVVALDFGGTIHVAFDQQRSRISAERKSGGVKKRPPGNDIFGLFDIRDDRFEGLAGAGGHACESERRTHQLEKPAARDGVNPFGSAFRKFAVHHFLEFRLAREFFQAAPEFRRVLLLDVGLYLDEIELVLLAGTNRLDLAVLFFVAHLSLHRPYGTLFFAPTLNAAPSGLEHICCNLSEHPKSL